MSVKALEAEFQKVYEQYHEMLQDIKDMEEDAIKGITPLDIVDRLKEQIKPIKDNFEWWSYVMFILHQPQKKEKQAAYKRRNKKLLDSIEPKNHPEARLEKGRIALNELKEFKVT